MIIKSSHIGKCCYGEYAVAMEHVLIACREDNIEDTMEDNTEEFDQKGLM